MAAPVMSKDNDSLADMLTALRQFTRRAPEPPAAPAVQPVRDTAAPLTPEESAKALLAAINRFAGFRSTATLERKLGQVLRNVPGEEIQALLDRVERGAQQELIAIVEDLTNHETFFFRDTMQLDPIARDILPELIAYQAKHERHLRIWSAACATGEEAYTLAVMALDALCHAGHAKFDQQHGYRLLNGWKLDVFGSDISRQAIRIAKAATYQESSFGSFRQMPDGWRRVFVPIGNVSGRYGNDVTNMTLLPSVRAHVRFDTFNLMSRNPPVLDMDLVLCRNVLIYIDVARQPDAINMITRSLRKGGYFVPSLVDQINERQLRPRWINRCAFYEKR